MMIKDMVMTNVQKNRPYMATVLVSLLAAATRSTSPFSLVGKSFLLFSAVAPIKMVIRMPNNIASIHAISYHTGPIGGTQSINPNIAKKRTVTKIQKLFQGPGFLKKREKNHVNKVEVTNKNIIVANMMFFVKKTSKS